MSIKMSSSSSSEIEFNYIDNNGKRHKLTVSKKEELEDFRIELYEAIKNKIKIEKLKEKFDVKTSKIILIDEEFNYKELEEVLKDEERKKIYIFTLNKGKEKEKSELLTFSFSFTPGMSSETFLSNVSSTLSTYLSGNSLTQALGELAEEIGSISEDTSEEIEESDNGLVSMLNSIIAPINQMSSERERYREELRTMSELGFTNESRNIEALIVSNGDVETAINYVMSM